MGKAGDAEQAAPSPAPATSNGSTLGRYGAAVGKALNARCAFVLLLAVGVVLSAFFLLLGLRASGIIPDNPGAIIGEIQASFILLKPRSQLASHATRLEEEIYREIEVPHNPTNTSIGEESMSTLRNNLIGLTVQQLNLFLTPSVFGDVFCLELLGFPGGITITVTLPLYNSTVDVQPIFKFTLDMSIHQIREYIEEMKIELACTLEQALHEGVFIDLTNKNGSTVTAPVTVQVSLSPDDRCMYLLPYRLKQIAEIITESNSRNLDLNPSVFGRIKDLKLSPPLQGFIPPRAPNLSPMPMPTPSRPPCSQPTTNNHQEYFLCPDSVKKTKCSLSTSQINAAISHGNVSTITNSLIVGTHLGARKTALQWQHQPSLRQHPNRSKVCQQLKRFQVSI